MRNRLHLCHDEEKTLTRLVDDWERQVKARPGASTVVLARTKAETHALSWLMRQRVLSQTPDAKRAIIEVSRDLDGRVTEPLEIAVGDRLRIGATQWEKQLFNGTVVTVGGPGGPARGSHGGVAQGQEQATPAGRMAEAGHRTAAEPEHLGPHHGADRRRPACGLPAMTRSATGTTTSASTTATP